MYSICYGENEIKFHIKRKDVKNINLTVKPNLEVLVSANDEVPLEYIKDYVHSKGKWIEKHLNYYEKTQSMPGGKKEYVNGESFRYLGKQYRLKVFKSADEGVKYFRGYIHLYVENLNNFHRKEELMESWYEEKSKIIFKDSLNRMHDLVKPYNIEFPELDIRKMRSRWGSCFPYKNKIILNSSLIKAPKDCIDYVTLHELIHFKYKNHNDNFYRLLNIIMPDWRGKKKILDEVVVREL